MKKFQTWLKTPGKDAQFVPWWPGIAFSGLSFLVLFIPSVVLIVSSPQPLIFVAAAIVGGVGLSLSIAFRRKLPNVMLLIALISCATILVSSVPLVFSIVLVPIIVYEYARWTMTTPQIALVAGLVGSIGGPLRWNLQLASQLDQPVLTSVVFTFLMVICCLTAVLSCYVTARYLRAAEDRKDEVQQSEARELRAELATRAKDAQVAEARTRTDIARELHDVVAHTLSVIVVQAEGGKAVAAKKPERAGEVLDTIATTSRDALNQMRHIVGVLRSDATDPVAEFGPAPDLGQIKDLVQKSGEQFRLEWIGPVPEVSPLIGLTAYRIVQEAITNTMKHAGEDFISLVKVEVDSDLLIIDVQDNGLGLAAHNDHHGNGREGMAERINATNGRIWTGPMPQGGFRVYAEIPLNGQKLSEPKSTTAITSQLTDPSPLTLGASHGT